MHVPQWIRPRDPVMVLLLSFFTCGIYQMVWYHHMYAEMEALVGETPTGHGYWIDLLLVVLTCSLFGVYVDYRLSQQLGVLREAQGARVSKDEPLVVVILDVAAYMSGWMTNIITTAMHQDQLNKVLNHPGQAAMRL